MRLQTCSAAAPSCCCSSVPFFWRCWCWWKLLCEHTLLHAHTLLVTYYVTMFLYLLPYVIYHTYYGMLFTMLLVTHHLLQRTRGVTEVQAVAKAFVPVLKIKVGN